MKQHYRSQIQAKKMVTQKPEATNGNKCSIKVGTTGTIGSLMSWELEVLKQASQASSSTQRKSQSAPVSIPCRSNLKKSELRRNLAHDASSGGSSNGNTESKKHSDVQKPEHNICKNGNQAPILGSEHRTMDRNNNRVEKKVNSYIVEVVDIKCNNLMSGRLKRLGFSKLS